MNIIDEMTIDEVEAEEAATEEQRRINILLLLKRKCERNIDYIIEELYPIYSDIERDLERKREQRYFTLWRALIYVFAFGEIYGVRKERARRAKRNVR